MKRASRKADGMRDFYDFAAGVRGQYASRSAEGTNVVVLDPDVAKVFGDRESVNETLRAVSRPRPGGPSARKKRRNRGA